MLYFLGIYLLFGVAQFIIFMAVLRARNVVINKDDHFRIFTMGCVLIVAYPYLAIRAAYKRFIKNNIIEAEVIK